MVPIKFGCSRKHLRLRNPEATLANVHNLGLIFDFFLMTGRQLTLDTNLYRAPAHVHAVGPGDFLAVRGAAGTLALREVTGCLIVGQQEPAVRVPVPHSRDARCVLSLGWSVKAQDGVGAGQPGTSGGWRVPLMMGVTKTFGPAGCLALLALMASFMFHGPLI